MVSSNALRCVSAQTTFGYVLRSASRIAATRSGASGFAVLPRFTFGATGSLTAIARAWAAETPSMAAFRAAGLSVCGGVSLGEAALDPSLCVYPSRSSISIGLQAERN